MKKDLRRDTLLVRAGLMRSPHQETSEAMYLNSGYVYDSAEDAAAAFAGEADRYVYSRYGNPTVTMFQDRLAALRGGSVSCDWYGYGSSVAALASQLNAGDRVVASRAVWRLLCHSEGYSAALGCHNRICGQDLDAWSGPCNTGKGGIFRIPSNQCWILLISRRQRDARRRCHSDD